MSPFDKFACEQELVEDCSLNTQSVKLGKTWKGMIFLNILWNEMESYVKSKTCGTFGRSLRRKSIKLMYILLSILCSQLIT